MKDLPVPPGALASPNGFEIARIWVAGGRQHAAIAASTWKDPAAWGLVLVDIARHVAQAYAESTGADVEGTLARIKEGLDAEWTTSTSGVEAD